MKKLKSREIQDKNILRQLELMNNQFASEGAYVLNRRQAGVLFDWIRKTYSSKGCESFFPSFPEFDFVNTTAENRLKITHENNEANKTRSHLSIMGQVKHEASSVFVYLPADKKTGEAEKLVNVYLEDINRDRKYYEPNAVTYYLSGEEGSKKINKITAGFKQENEIILNNGEDIQIMAENINSIVQEATNPNCEYPGCEFLDDFNM